MSNEVSAVNQFYAALHESASLIGRLGSSAFRLSTAAALMSLAGSCFSPESAHRPLYGAFLVKKFKQGSASFFSPVSLLDLTLALFARRLSGHALGGLE